MNKYEFKVKNKYLYGIMSLCLIALSAALFVTAFFVAANVKVMFVVIGACALSGLVGLVFCHLQRNKCWFYAVEIARKIQIVLLFSLFILLAVFLPLAIIL